MPTCWIIAGPNGAGKTTFALRYLPLVAKCRNVWHMAGTTFLQPTSSAVLRVACAICCVTSAIAWIAASVS